MSRLRYFARSLIRKRLSEEISFIFEDIYAMLINQKYYTVLSSSLQIVIHSIVSLKVSSSWGGPLPQDNVIMISGKTELFLNLTREREHGITTKLEVCTEMCRNYYAWRASSTVTLCMWFYSKEQQQKEKKEKKS